MEMRWFRLVVLVGTVLGAGCSVLDNDEPAEQARVRLNGTSGVDLELVTSTEFGFSVDPTTGNRETVLIQSDTAMIRPPYDEVFDISQRGIFLVRLTNAEQEAADVTLEVSIDGSGKISQQMVIGADEGGVPGRFEWSWLN